MASASYVPLWCKSCYSFLEGASRPEELVLRAREYALPALALTDRDGVYGAVRAHIEARRVGLHLIVGSQITVEDGRSVLLLAQDRGGYANLCRLITLGRRRCAKGRSEVGWDEVAGNAEGLIALLECDQDGFAGSTRKRVLPGLRDAFGDRLYGLVVRDRTPRARRESRSRERAARLRIPLAAATEVLYHVPERRRLQDVLTCIRRNVTLEQAGTLLRPNAQHALKTTQELAALYADDPALLERTREIAERCTFSLDALRYRYPSEDLPDGKTSAGRLRELTLRGARERYSGRGREAAHGCDAADTHDAPGIPADVREQLERELALIDELDYCGYFLTMWDIVRFCRREGILCQGRGSAANSAVCYCLGITAVDPVRMNLLFERFISRERAEPPDIDLDIEHRRREEVIRYVYRKYGRERAAMVANFVRYRVRSAVRDVGRALGLPSTRLDRLARLLPPYGRDVAAALRTAGVEIDDRAGKTGGTGGTDSLMASLAQEILDFPRHLSIHPGGFLLGAEPVSRYVPVENAAMPGRTVIQWDKHDVEDMGLFKVDLLGLGALTHLDYAFRLLEEHRGVSLSMDTIPAEDAATFEMISRADTVGVFQIESRAQMAMLPRLRPRCFYDLVIEVSIVRPGPITGNMVHPFLRRRRGEEAVKYPHPDLEPILKKTLGVPLFQEQVMRIAMVAADYTPGEADQLRRDMAAWRIAGKMDRHERKLIERMIRKGIAPDFARRVFDQIRGFGEYGFPESHAASFALIGYCTAWLKRHYPAEFTCALLNAWPMGFYTPATVVEDAKRHGVELRPVDVLRSGWECTLEPAETAAPADPPATADAFAVRIGLRFVKGLGEGDLARIRRARDAPAAQHGPDPAARHGPDGLARFIRRAGLDEDVLAALAESGALLCFGLDRRTALWEVLGTGRSRKAGAQADRSEGPVLLSGRETSPELPALQGWEQVGWDFGTTGHSVRGHLLEPLREELSRQGLPDARALSAMRDGDRVSYVGMVICRQRPATAGGVMFMTLEDESGFVNLVVWKRVFERFRTVALTQSLLGVTGKLQSKAGVVGVVVEECWVPRISAPPPSVASRDFH